MKFKYLIDDIAIVLWFSWTFVSMNDIWGKCNPMVNLSKFKSNKKISNSIVDLDYNQVCSQILSI